MKKFLLSFQMLGGRLNSCKPSALAILSLFFLFSMAKGQQTLKGLVTDGTNPIGGATISIAGTTNATSTDANGLFSIHSSKTDGILIVSYVGFETQRLRFSTETTDLGTITLQSGAQSLDEVIVQVGSGIIDLAKDRKTPIAVSTVSPTEIQQKAGNQEFPELLKNTPSVYIAGQGGGYGDARIIVRGFDAQNTAYLINGQPVNSMEDGKLYWSNWSGLADVANALQIQRGLGSSKLAISSVGGTVNIVTKSTDMTRKGFVQSIIGNNNYQKNTIAYSTGLSESGWAASVLLTNWAGDGYNKGMYGHGQNYFFSLGYKPNERHSFNFMIFGAPQQHDQNYTKKVSDFLKYGKKFNANYGSYRGDYYTERTNYYHKPVTNINWDFNIDEKSTLSTVLYASWGRGGGTGGTGKGKVYDESGHIDFDAISANNQMLVDGIGSGGDAYATRASVNNHAWYGLISNFNHEINENWNYNLGVDVRTYKGTHYQMLTNLLGLNGWRVTDNVQYPDGYTITKTFSINPWKALTNSVDDDQKISYDYDERITYEGAFGQLEYATDEFSAFVQGALSNQSHVRWDRFQYTKEEEKSEKVNNIGYNAKAGLSYTVAQQHTFFANAGYYSRQPYHDNIYLTFGNTVNPLTNNEKILGLELGYRYASRFFSANVNVYNTSWKDRVTTDILFDDAGVQYFETSSGLKQLHRGIEVDFVAKPTTNLDIKGFASIGDWKYDDDAYKTKYTEDLDVISETVEDVKGGKVGDAAQTTFGLGAVYRITNALSVDMDYRNYSNLYSTQVIKDNIKLPNYDIVDAGINYKIRFDKTSLNLRLNVNNVFDRVYFTEMTSAIAVEEGASTYRGINTDNYVLFGNGTTWNIGARFDF